MAEKRYKEVADTDGNKVKISPRTGKPMMKPRGGGAPQNRVNTEEGDNAKYLKHALAAWDLPKVDTKDEKAVAERIKNYFEYCAENDIRPQMVALANWLGVSREALAQWRRGEVGRHQEAISKAVMIMESLWADYMQNGKINPVSGIFLAKVWYGYKDQTEYVITPNKAEAIATEDLIAEAQMLPGIEQKDDE